MLVVMPDGNMGTGGLAGFNENVLRSFESELKQSVIPFVEKNYHAETDAKNRALAGLSMGGLQTLYAGIKNTNIFSRRGYLVLAGLSIDRNFPIHSMIL
ncbi:MAG: alpha/beta hydrolase-fold protein [Chitinophagaceae bacterium]